MTDLNHSTAAGTAVGWRFDNTYVRLPDVLFAAAAPARVRQPEVVILNHRLACELGLNLKVMSAEAAASLFAGQVLPPGSQPIAQAYAGHQYGHFTMLGDGRAILWAEHVTPSGTRVDLQFKGSGPTPFSRRGDGRAALGPMLREYIISEAMSALGIPTTRSLAVVTTGETVLRQLPQRGAVLTRVAASHLRVGTFEYLAARQDVTNLRVLADYAMARHYPELAGTPGNHARFLEAVIDRQASLIARWQAVGFIHGVMNTDNMALSGETIDYGPCAFMNSYRPDTVYSSIDHGGRYAYGNQPAIAHWNLARFAETLLPLIDSDPDAAIAQATAILEQFPDRYLNYWLASMRVKLGLETVQPDDAELIQGLLDWMEVARADFTNTFRDLADGATTPQRERDTRFQAWLARWQSRLAGEGRTIEAARQQMRTVNPAVIPRNHAVEQVLTAAEQHQDLTPLHRLVDALSSPYESPADTTLREPSPDDDRYQTFCGT